MFSPEIDNKLQTKYVLQNKEVFIQLENYEFFHSPYSTDPEKEDTRFIGRKKLLDHLQMILENSKTKSGAYLITGFRGMGKTSLVRKVIKEVNARIGNNSNNKTVVNLKAIEISLAQDDLNETVVFRLICRHLLYDMEEIWKNAARSGLIPDNPKHFGSEKIDLSDSSEFSQVMKDLRELDERLSAQIRFRAGEKEDSDNTGKVSISRDSDKIYPIAGPKEIEWRLIRILENIEKIRGNYYIPDFIFIFDELDKIEPNSKLTISEKEAEDPTYDLPEVKSSTDKVRKRKETVAALLANLKNFLNKARSKFIFIGGREMYDAALADTADRDSFYSSIFHDVLYVDSFLKDGLSKQGSGLTRMTETYLCKLLIPSSYLENLKLVGTDGETHKSESEIYNLRIYFKYLSSGFMGDEKSNVHRTFNRKELYEIIYLLQNFIIYLTYRSNGTPKKLTDLFEDYIVPENESFLQNQYVQLIGVKKNDETQQKEPLYLHFTTSDQYVIGLTSVIFRPYIITHSRHQKIWGDKLLFSTAYIIDHIFKFHSFGFSWRNLELVPELITINKAPQLRTFIKELLQHYSNTFIRTTTGGLFHYKFFNKNANEIKCVSKISDLSAAAFNFTLDESLMIKRHYYKKLNELRKSYSNYIRYEGRSGFVHSIGFIHSILGDLHYYDQEYDEAIIQYSDAIQHLRTIDIKNLTEHQVILMITNKLKLGLTLEKIQSYESAFTVYREIIDKLPEFYEASSEQVEKAKMARALNQYMFGEDATDPEKNDFRGFRLFNQAFMAILGVLEKMRADGLTDFDLVEYEYSLKKFLGFEGEEVLLGREKPGRLGISDWEKMPELKNTLIANYYSNVGSLLFFKNKNLPATLIRFIEYDLKFRRMVRKSAAAGIDSDQFDIYHKYLSELGGLNEYDYNPSLSAYVYYRESQRWLLRRFERELAPIRKLIIENPDDRILFKGFLLNDKIPANPYLFDIFILLSDKVARPLNAYHANDLGNIFSKIGDALLTFISAKLNSPPSMEVLKKLFDGNVKERGKGDFPDKPPIQSWIEAYNLITKNTERFYSLDLVFFTYRLAAQFYLKASQIYSYAFQYKKVLYVLKDFLSGYRQAGDKDAAICFDPDFIEFIKDKIAVQIIKAITWENKTANRPQVLKYKDVFHLERELMPGDAQSIINNVSTGTETWETVMLVSDIQLKLTRISLDWEKENTPHTSDKLDLKLDYVRYSPYMSISSKFVKIMEHKYKADVNRLFLKEWKFEEMLRAFEKDKNKPDAGKSVQDYRSRVEIYLDENSVISIKEMTRKFSAVDIFKDKKPDVVDMLEYLITDSIYNLAELVHHLNLYGLNYMTSYSYLGYTHYKLATWCRFYRTILRIQDKKDEEKTIFKKLEKLLGRDFLYFLDIKYHYELSIQYFHSALQLHREGKAYRDVISGMYFLEDDFNDNLYHFCAGLERYKINTGSIRKMINKLKQKVERGTVNPDDEDTPSLFYKYDSYVNNGEWDDVEEDDDDDDDDDDEKDMEN
ncbi:MAG: ATP-binding protein [Bacteroidia bacterium]